MMNATATCARCGAPTLGPDPNGGLNNLCPRCVLGFAMEEDGAPAAPGLKAGATFGRYEILQTLGAGGMGVVYKARDTQLQRIVALKTLTPRPADSVEFEARFLREAMVLARLKHPNIVSIHEVGKVGDVLFLTMEYVEGVTLRQLLVEKRLPPEEALQIVPQLCDALEYAHGQGVVHRDIKPENILVDTAGCVKIADFGLAKVATGDPARRVHTLTSPNISMGTPHYMAPEQVENTHQVDHRADIYSMGVVFYEMLTGELPIGRFKPPSRRATVNSRLDQIVLKTLEKEPGDRYQRASEVKAAVSGIDADGNPVPSTRISLRDWMEPVGLGLVLLFAGLSLAEINHRASIFYLFMVPAVVVASMGTIFVVRGRRAAAQGLADPLVKDYPAAGLFAIGAIVLAGGVLLAEVNHLPAFSLLGGVGGSICAAATAIHLGRRAQGRAAAPRPQPGTSRLAVAGLLFSLVGISVPLLMAFSHSPVGMPEGCLFVGLPVLLGVGLSIAGLISVVSSKGTRTGLGYAISGIIVSALWIAIVPLLFFSAMRAIPAPAPSTTSRAVAAELAPGIYVGSDVQPPAPLSELWPAFEAVVRKGAPVADVQAASTPAEIAALLPRLRIDAAKAADFRQLRVVFLESGIRLIGVEHAGTRRPGLWMRGPLYDHLFTSGQDSLLLVCWEDEPAAAAEFHAISGALDEMLAKRRAGH